MAIESGSKECVSMICHVANFKVSSKHMQRAKLLHGPKNPISSVLKKKHHEQSKTVKREMSIENIPVGEDPKVSRMTNNEETKEVLQTSNQGLIDYEQRRRELVDVKQP